MCAWGEAVEAVTDAVLMPFPGHAGDVTCPWPGMAGMEKKKRG